MARMNGTLSCVDFMDVNMGDVPDFRGGFPLENIYPPPMSHCDFILRIYGNNILTIRPYMVSGAESHTTMVLFVVCEYMY